MTVDFNGYFSKCKPPIFVNLRPGDVFLVENYLYMKTQEIWVNSDDESCCFNAVNMKTGELRSFLDCAIVTLIDGEFKVNC